MSEALSMRQVLSESRVLQQVLRQVLSLVEVRAMLHEITIIGNRKFKLDSHNFLNDSGRD